MVKMAKTTKINKPSALSARVERYCHNLEDWPRSWMGFETDLPPGEKIVRCFRPFIEHLVSTDLFDKNNPKTHRQPVGVGR
jgi:hypothetical protein